MIRHFLLSISALMVVGVATTVSAQQRPAARPPAAQPTPTPSAPATPPATVALPTSKMAVIYTDVFLDQKTGIASYSVLVKLKANSEAKRRSHGDAERAQTLESETPSCAKSPPEHRSIKRVQTSR